MSLSVKFNGVELANYISVLKGFTPFDSPSWKPQLNSSGTKNGADFETTYYKEKQIDMPFDIDIDQTKIDDLKRVLNVDEPKMLIFGNYSDRFFYAIPSGSLDFDEMKVYGTGTITWIVPDGVAHSTSEKTFNAALNENGEMEMIINNDGTAPAAINYDITHNHENGFIGIVSEYGAMQYGKVDEVDTETLQRSEELFRYSNPTDFGAMTDGQGILTEDFPKNGSWKTMSHKDKQYIALNGVGSGSSWHGASKMVTLPEDSSGSNVAQNFFCQTRVWFEAGRNTQTGLMEFVIGDEDGKLLASIHVLKNSTNDAKARVIMKIADKEVKRIEFTANGSSPVALNAGQLYIRKTGGKFEFYYHGKHTFNRSDLANKKAKSVTIFVGQYGSRKNSVDDLVNRMYFEYLFFRKDNVSYIHDIPNRYSKGSVMHIDGEEGKMYLDGVDFTSDEIVGTKYFKAQPGETKVQFAYSSFSDPAPTIKAYIKEAWL